MIQYPSISEYEKNIKKLGGKVLNLPTAYEFIPNSTIPIKVYKIASGAFAGVFKIKEISTGKLYALRVFLNTAKPEKIQRVTQISDYLSTFYATWLCKTSFYRNGIHINGQSFPVTLMEWCSGIPLNEYVTKIINQNNKITELQEKIVALSQELENKDIAHGDIQSGNVLVEDSPQGIRLKLVDYDPMFIPLLVGKSALETGHSSFQHPKRTKNQYDKTIDRFSFWVLLTALEAIKYDKTLWQKDMQGGFNDEDNFLFKAKDFESPNTSILIAKLRSINKESLNYYLNELLSSFNDSKRNPLSLFKGNTSINVTNKINTPQVSKPSIPPTKPNITIPVNNNGSVFKITSNPNNAQVFFNGQEIGTTPIELNVNDYHSKMIKLSKDEYTAKTVFLSKSQMVYSISLDRQIPIYSHQTISPPSYTPQPPQQNTSSNNKKGCLIKLIKLVGVIIILYIFRYLLISLFHYYK